MFDHLILILSALRGKGASCLWYSGSMSDSRCGCVTELMRTMQKGHSADRQWNHWHFPQLLDQYTTETTDTGWILELHKKNMYSQFPHMSYGGVLSSQYKTKRRQKHSVCSINVISLSKKRLECQRHRTKTSMWASFSLIWCFWCPKMSKSTVSDTGSIRGEDYHNLLDLSSTSAGRMATENVR